MTNNFYPNHINIHAPSQRILRGMGINGDKYQFCFIAKQMQSVSGWVECGVRNAFRFPHPLKCWIGAQVGLFEWQVNYMFREMQKDGFIQVSPCKQKFRITEKFQVFKKADNADLHDQEAFEKTFPNEGNEQPTIYGAKLTFTQSPYNSLDTFKAVCADFKVPNVDAAHYFEKFQQYYTVEHPNKVFTDWHGKITEWLKGDLLQGRLIRTKADKDDKKATPSVSPIAKLNDGELTNELDFWYSKLKEPETDSFEEYKEIAETYKPYALEALKRKDRILNANGRTLANRVLETINDKKKLREAFDKIVARKNNPPPSVEEDTGKDNSP